MLYAQGWPGTCIQSTQCQTYVMHGVKCTHSAKRNHARCQMYTQCQTYVMHGVKCKHSAKRFSCTVPNVHTVSNVCHANVHTVPNVRHTRCQMYTQCQTYVVHGVKRAYSAKRSAIFQVVHHWHFEKAFDQNISCNAGSTSHAQADCKGMRGGAFISILKGSSG